jgi:hypothetical protein
LIKSGLHQLEKLIAELLAEEEDRGYESQPGSLKRQAMAVQACCTALKEKWLHVLLSAAKEIVITRYIRYHQAVITMLSNQVSVLLSSCYGPEPANERHECYLLVTSSVDSLLQFIKNGFPSYFDHEQPVSNHHYRLQLPKIKLLLASDRAALEEINIEPSLVDVITITIDHKLGEAKLTGISYQQLDHCHTLLEMIRQALAEHPAITTTVFARLLYQQNFNSYYFTLWFKDRLYARFTELAEEHRESAILQEINMFSSIFVTRDIIMEPALPPADVQIIPWLQQLLPGQHEPDPITALKMTEPARMPLGFSVVQFALFIRLCCMERCFPANNVSDTLRFFIRHFETKKQSHISFKSFAHAFYSADQATAAVVRDFLQRMINTIDKTYFP